MSLLKPLERVAFHFICSGNHFVTPINHFIQCYQNHKIMSDLEGNFAEDERSMPKYIILTNSNEVVRVSPERIAYITSDGNYSSMMLIDSEKHIFSFNLSAFEKIIERQLESEVQTLIRLGKRLIINSRYIYYINIGKKQIILSDINCPTKFTLSASKESLRKLKATLEESVMETI